MNRCLRSRTPTRRANFAVVAVMFSLLIGFSAMVVDLGMARMATVQLQAGVDASALAGTAYLDGTEEGMELAVDKAAELLDNRVLGTRLSITPENVVTGIYDPAFHTFTPSAEALLVNAMHVDHTYGGITLFFDIWGIEDLATYAAAIAAQPDPVGAGAVDCYLPIALPDCYLEQPEAAESLLLRFDSSRKNNAGWGRRGAVQPDAAFLDTQLNDSCSSGEAVVGDVLTTTNGTITSALQDVEALLETSDEVWDEQMWGPMPAYQYDTNDASGSCGDDEGLGGIPTTSSFYDSTSCTGSPGGCWGRVMAGPVLVINSGGECGCSHHFNKTSTITGFIWAILYDVNTRGSDKNIRMKVDLTNVYAVGTREGLLDTNVTYDPPPILVR